MNKFKERWEIKHNWQLLFPILGVLGLAYSGFKLASVFLKDQHVALIILLSILFYFILLKITLFLFKKLENKWVVDFKWEMIRIFLVFAITGSSSLFIGRPIMKFIGITKENLNGTIYWILYLVIGLIFYQISLVLIGWLFGQYKFFWEFEKKMLIRLGFKRFLN